MELVEIAVESRDSSGSAESRRMRAEGRLPVIVVARGEASLPCWTPRKEFVQSAQRTRSSQLFALKSSSPKLNGKTAIVKEIQCHSISGDVLHVDLQALHENEEVELQVVLKFEGQAPGVITEGGVLTIAQHELSIKCLPRSIPEEIKVDISQLALGQSIHAGDIALSEGVRLAGNPEETIVSVVTVRTVVEAAPTAVAVEGAAAAEGAAAGQAAPAAGEKSEKEK